MKRSHINSIIEEAIDFFDRHGFRLPPWAYWSIDDWRAAGGEADEIRNHGLGWNVTDFGQGHFEDVGLTLLVLRNGKLVHGKPATSKTYAEKIMKVRPGQTTPWHFHWMKTEDLINRGGGRLEIELAWIASDEQSLAPEEVLVQVDGISRRVPARGKIILEPGESVTLPPRLCHQFTGCPLDNAVCVGEVSSLNDDNTDNCFVFCAGWRKIEEDVPARYWLLIEYPVANIVQ